MLIRFPLTSLILSILLFPVLIKVLKDNHMLRSPGERHVHRVQKPSMGGLVVFITAAIGVFIWISMHDLIPYKGLSISLIIMLIIGLRDDLLELTPPTKFVSQFVPVAFLVLLQGARISSGYTLFDYQFSEVGVWILTTLTILAITNSFNLIDGIDGLAGTMGLLSLTCFGSWLYLTNQIVLSDIAFSFGGSILGFLAFNWSPSKIFMGDTGSLVIGLLNAFLAITFLNSNATLATDHAFNLNNALTFAICVLSVPLFDTVRVFVIRISRMKSPFVADKNHLHHNLLMLGLSHGGATTVLTLLNIFFIALAIVLRDLPDWLGLLIVVALCLSIHLLLERIVRSKAALPGSQIITQDSL